jgi:hypothetical protein
MQIRYPMEVRQRLRSCRPNQLMNAMLRQQDSQ